MPSQPPFKDQELLIHGAVTEDPNPLPQVGQEHLAMIHKGQVAAPVTVNHQAVDQGGQVKALVLLLAFKEWQLCHMRLEVRFIDHFMQIGIIMV